MTKPFYSMPLPERVRRAREVLEAVGETISSKGGHAKAQKAADALNKRNQQIRDEFAHAMKSSKVKKRIVVGQLATKHELSKRTINKVLLEI
jgi:hypothetical protein